MSEKKSKQAAGIKPGDKPGFIALFGTGEKIAIYTPRFITAIHEARSEAETRKTILISVKPISKLEPYEIDG